MVSFARTVLVVARFHRSPQGNWGASLPRVPSSVRGQMTSQTALTINHNGLVESVSPQMGRVSLAELRKTCGRTDPASEGWPCCISGTLRVNWNPRRRLSSPGVPVAQWSGHPTGVCGGPGFDSYLEFLHPLPCNHHLHHSSTGAFYAILSLKHPSQFLRTEALHFRIGW